MFQCTKFYELVQALTRERIITVQCSLYIKSMGRVLVVYTL